MITELIMEMKIDIVRNITDYNYDYYAGALGMNYVVFTRINEFL